MRKKEIDPRLGRDADTLRKPTEPLLDFRRRNFAGSSVPEHTYETPNERAGVCMIFLGTLCFTFRLPAGEEGVCYLSQGDGLEGDLGLSLVSLNKAFQYPDSLRWIAGRQGLQRAHKAMKLISF